jgi:hypothetical protein
MVTESHGRRLLYHSSAFCPVFLFSEESSQALAAFLIRRALSFGSGFGPVVARNSMRDITPAAED